MSDVTFYTVSEAGFFLGTVALLNSLRLKGHREALVVLDAGLTSSQRDRLAEHVSVVPCPADVLKHPYTLKPFPFLLSATGTVVVIDSDMIVTRSLAPLLHLAVEGKICMFPDPPIDRGRWFAEWQEAFALRAPLRHQMYLNSGFVALSTKHWPDLLERWWTACDAIPPESLLIEVDHKFRDSDQDALNAILMSEVAPDAVAPLPESGELYSHESGPGVLVDERALTCVSGADSVSIVHQSLRPKVWNPSGWRRIRWNPDDVFCRLLPRVLLGEDVVLRLEPRDLPWWLRLDARGRIGVGALKALARSRRRGQRLAARLAPRAVRHRAD